VLDWPALEVDAPICLYIAEAEEAARQRREADMRHKARIVDAAAVALVAVGLSVDDAMTSMRAISDGKVPHVHISY
jgi:hypothetical protein